MTTEALAGTPPAHSQACVLARSLHDMLEQEFVLLKSQDLDAFDAQQDDKTALLTQLGTLADVRTSADADALGPEWNDFKDLMRDCRDLHRRNEIFIHRKLDAIRGALQSLRAEDPTSSVEVYDRLGKVNRRQRGRGYTDA